MNYLFFTLIFCGITSSVILQGGREHITRFLRILFMCIQRIKQWFSRWFKSSKPSGMGDKLSGVIKFFDRKKRFGFIIAGDQEYFFHAAATRPKDFKSFQEGVAVTFKLSHGKKGMQADHIEIVR